MSRREACSYIAIPGYRKFSGDSVLIHVQASLHDCNISNLNNIGVTLI